MNFIGNYSKAFCTNAGSIKEFTFVPVEDVDVFDANLFDFILNEITLKAGKSWIKGYSTHEKIQVDQDTKDSDHGTIYQPYLSGFAPGYNYYLEKLFAYMLTGRFIVDITDNNDERYMLGTIENGARFGYKYSSGNLIKTLNGYSFRFYHDSAQPRLRYNEGNPVPMPPVL